MNTVSTASNEPLKMQKLFQFNIESKFTNLLLIKVELKAKDKKENNKSKHEKITLLQKKCTIFTFLLAFFLFKGLKHTKRFLKLFFFPAMVLYIICIKLKSTSYSNNNTVITCGYKVSCLYKNLTTHTNAGNFS